MQKLSPYTTMRQHPSRPPSPVPPAISTHLLSREEELVPLGDLLGELLAAAHLPDVRQVLALVVVVGGLSRVGVL